MTAPDSFKLPPLHHSRGVALMLLSVACFTANVLLIRVLGLKYSVDIWLVSCVRFLVGITVLATVYRQQVRFARVFTHGNLAGRGIVGGLGVAVYYVTVVHIGAGRATFINNVYIILAALLAVWVLKERFRPALLVGGVAALAGLALLTNVFATGARINGYDLLAIGGAIASAYVVVTIRVLHGQGEHTSTIFAAQCLYGLLLCGVPAAVFWSPVPEGAWLLMAGAGLLAAIGQLAMTGGFRDLPVAEGSLLQMLVPLGIAVGGLVFFQEHFTPHELLGAALILVGTVVTVLKR